MPKFPRDHTFETEDHDGHRYFNKFSIFHLDANFLIICISLFVNEDEQGISHLHNERTYTVHLTSVSLQKYVITIYY